MIEPIDAIRSLRPETHSFERCISALTVAIGDIERLSKVEPDQLDRIRAAVIRLSNAERKFSGAERIAERKASK